MQDNVHSDFLVGSVSKYIENVRSNMSHYQDSPYNTLWQYHFPFEYWYNRLEKINPHNDADRLEALYSMVTLTEVYSRAFSAAVQNPTHPWYYLNDHIHVSDVEVAFDVLQTEGNTTVGRVSRDSNETTTVDAEDDLNLDETDAITVSLLGIPYKIDDEGTLELQESPELHRDICKAILNTAERQTPLQQAFSQGFCIFPVLPGTVENVIDSAGMLGEEDRESFQNQMESLRNQYEENQWPLTVAQLERQSTNQGDTLQLRVFHVDVWTCYKFAELVLDALFNLISLGPRVMLQDSLSDIPVDVLEEEVNLIELILGIETPIQDQPIRIVTEEILEQNCQ
jgi:hypothetical protein